MRRVPGSRARGPGGTERQVTALAWCSRQPVWARAGDSFIAVGPSGGGYGDPLDRDPEQVREDVLDGYLSAETALRDYGVVVTDRGELDHEATARTRLARRG